MADNSPNSSCGSKKVPTVPRFTKFDHCAVIEVKAYFKEHASRHTVLPTLSDETCRISDPTDPHEMPAVEAPYLYPAQDGGSRARI